GLAVHFSTVESTGEIDEYAVRSGGIVGRIVSCPANETIRAAAADQDVIVAVAVQLIVAAAADEHILSVAAMDNVIAVAAVEPVVGSRAGDAVVVFGTDDVLDVADGGSGLPIRLIGEYAGTGAAEVGGRLAGAQVDVELILRSAVVDAITAIAAID